MNALDVLAYAIIGVVALAGLILAVMTLIEDPMVFKALIALVVIPMSVAWAIIRVAE